MIAGVPLVVVIRTVLPSTTARLKSRGELPRSNPGIGFVFRSPARRTSARSNALARITASSEVSTGMTVRAPLASAAAMLVDARNTSMTATTRPTNSDAGAKPAPNTTSIRMLRQLLEELRLAFEEFGIDLPSDESRVLHHAGEKWNGRRHALDDEAIQRDMHSGNRLGSIAALADELGQQRVIERWNGVAVVDVRVEADARSTRRMKRENLAGRRLEVARRIFSVDTAFDDVTSKRWELRHAEFLARCDANLLLHEIDAREHLRHGMLDLD